MIAFRCSCGADMFLEPEDLGQTAECPECDQEVAVPAAPHLDNAKRVCPVCAGRDWNKITTRRALKKKLPPPPPRKASDGDDEMNTAFTFSLPRECNDCGTIWLPPAPAWALILLMLFGAFFAIGAAAELLELLPDRGATSLPRAVVISGGIAGLGLVG